MIKIIDNVPKTFFETEKIPKSQNFNRKSCHFLIVTDAFFFYFPVFASSKNHICSLWLKIKFSLQKRLFRLKIRNSLQITEISWSSIKTSYFSQSSKILKVASSRNSSCAKIFGIFKVQSPKLSIFGHDGEFGGFGEFGMKSKSSKERRL